MGDIRQNIAARVRKSAKCTQKLNSTQNKTRKIFTMQRIIFHTVKMCIQLYYGVNINQIPLFLVSNIVNKQLTISIFIKQQKMTSTKTNIKGFLFSFHSH